MTENDQIIAELVLIGEDINNLKNDNITNFDDINAKLNKLLDCYKKCVCDDCPNIAVLYDFATHERLRCYYCKIKDDYWFNGIRFYKWDGKECRVKCNTIICNKQPTFGDPITKIAKHCWDHMLDSDIDVKHKRCKFCNKQPSFGDPTTNIAKHCWDHMLDTDVDVINKKCEFCTTRPSFGDPITKIAKHCWEHMLDSDVDVVNKKCLFCNKQPSFGDPVTKIIKHCWDHMLTTDVDVRSKKCLFCDKQPNFGDINTEIAKHCWDHMLITDIDVKHKKCEFCSTRPNFGDPITKIVKYCWEHKLITDINLNSKRCEFPSCIIFASFGDPIEKVRHNCSRHKLINYINLNHKICIQCNIKNVYLTDICYICDPSLSERIEHKVVNYLINHINELFHNFIHNKVVKESSGIAYRPDLLYRFVTHAIIVEIDENQHKAYKVEDEKIRTKAICSALKCPVVFIRFNPHRYKINGKTFDKPLEDRLNQLSLCILQKMNNVPTKPLTITKLYFDQ